ncbi:hypothetical protein OPV22_012158 [Ensete ventricosum]|uniref:Uncharacterized protein n=1 Tax=Ensete ventricosum TaxID=4639 RepID=A0AAV8R6G3_ENSVE|nr:hypothetical protein OPV22_012158 [Ensete ventricosum]
MLPIGAVRLRRDGARRPHARVGPATDGRQDGVRAQRFPVMGTNGRAASGSSRGPRPAASRPYTRLHEACTARDPNDPRIPVGEMKGGEYREHGTGAPLPSANSLPPSSPPPPGARFVPLWRREAVLSAPFKHPRSFSIQDIQIDSSPCSFAVIVE